MKKLIYIQVLGFPGGLLQPVSALHVHGNCYRVLESSDDQEHDPWEFGDGDVVRCESRSFSEAEVGLIGVAACSCGSAHSDERILA